MRRKRPWINSEKKIQRLHLLVISGRKLAKTRWGKAWNNNLESYTDYENRIDRGRSYVRHGAVLDLKIESGVIKALVQVGGQIDKRSEGYFLSSRPPRRAGARERMKMG